MRFLVTGGCGFVGSAVVRTLIARGEHVLNLDRRRKVVPLPALEGLARKPGYARFEADVSDRALMRVIFREFRPDKVIHLAADRADTSETAYDSEVGATCAVLEACHELIPKLDDEEREAFRIVVSRSVPLDPADPEAPLPLPTPLDATRSAAWVLADGLARAHDLPLVACQAGEVFGPWQDDARFMATLIRALLDNTRVTLPASGLTRRDWLPVGDLALGLVCAALNGRAHSMHDLSLGAERRDVDIAESVCALLDERLGLDPAGSRSRLIDLVELGEIHAHPLLDTANVESRLGWQPRGFHAGLGQMLSWAIKQVSGARRAVAA